MSELRLILCERCGEPLARHCKNWGHFNPHCPGECRKKGQTWLPATALAATTSLVNGLDKNSDSNKT